MPGTTITGTAAMHGACGTNTYNLDVGRWHRFYLIAGNTYTFSTCNVPQATAMYLTHPSTPTLIYACDAGGCGGPGSGSFITFVPTVSQTYRLYIYNGACSVVYPALTMMEMVMTCAPATIPSNNLPCGATPLPMSGSACNFTTSSNISASNSAVSAPAGVGALPAPSCTGNSFQGSDVWFTTTVPASGLIGIQTEEGSICAGGLQLFTTTNCGAAANFTQLPNNNCTTVGTTGPTSEPAMVYDAFAVTPTPLAVGSTVYIRYWERGGNENGTFGICAFEAQRPPNDEPCAPIALPLNNDCQLQNFSYENATPSGVAAPTCGGTTVNDVWFTFTVPATVPVSGITVNTNAPAPLSFAMAWYRLTPPCSAASLTQIACSANGSYNSAAGAPGLLNGGETIYVRVWNQNSWFGNYSICAFINQTPPNDEPCGALVLPLNYACMMSTFSNAAATTSITAPAPSCGAPATNDVWYRVTVPPDGNINFSTLAGSLTDAAMAVYRVNSGSCATNNLTLGLIGGANCSAAVGGNPMPGLNITGQAAGTTLYVRVWRQGGNDGTFSMCGARIDPPPGVCYYKLNMFDSAGDGWGGSYVTVCVGGACTNYTVYGSNAVALIGANPGQPLTVSYTGTGSLQNQNSYSLQQYNITIFAANAPLVQGVVYSTTVDCTPPHAPQSDCLGSAGVCNMQQTLNSQLPITGAQELHAGNRGCLLGNEHPGLWYSLTTVADGTLAFNISPNPVVDYDWAVWGPYTTSNLGNICPPASPPIRCNFSGVWGDTGLQINSSLPNTGGGPFNQHLTVTAGQLYLLYVDRWTNQPSTFNLTFSGTAAIDCVNLPVEFLSLEASAKDQQVQVDWMTATERNSAWFEVERSADGVEFQKIGRVPAAVYSQAPIGYTFIDEMPLEGVSYYRLHQVDQDGAGVNTHMVSVTMQGLGGLQVHPNPAFDVLTVNMLLEREQQLQWRIVDMSGRGVDQGRFAGTEGRLHEKLNVGRLDPGGYILHVTDAAGATVGTARFVKQ